MKKIFFLLIGKCLFVLKTEPSKTNQMGIGSLLLILGNTAVIISESVDFFPLKGLWRDGELNRLFSVGLAS